MDTFVGGIGSLFVMAVVIGLFAYAIRNRGRIVKWLKNDNVENGQSSIVERSA